MSSQVDLVVQTRITGAKQRKRNKLWNEQWRRRGNDVIVGAMIPLMILLLWQLAGAFGWISVFFLPTPSMIAAHTQELLLSGDLFSHLSISVQRALLGFVIGGGIGFLCGLLVGFSRTAEHVLDPTFQMLRMIPHLALAPLIILWFGFGETSKIFIIANGAFFPMYINTFMGLRSVDNRLFDVAKVLEFNRFKLITGLIVPAASPQIMLGLRTSLAVSWLGLVVAELIGSQAGIGFIINLGKQTSVTELIFIGVIIFAIVGKLFDSFVRLLEKKWLNWRDSYLG